jgi:hypothetical protein
MVGAAMRVRYAAGRAAPRGDKWWRALPTGLPTGREKIGKELATSRFLSVITAPRDTVSDHPSFVTLTRRGLPVHMHPAPPEDILPSRQGKKNPLVLVGAAVTAGVLTVGFVAFKAGNANLSQTMMKARVFAQGATVALMVGTSGAAVLPSFTGSK